MTARGRLLVERRNRACPLYFAAPASPPDERDQAGDDQPDRQGDGAERQGHEREPAEDEHNDEHFAEIDAHEGQGGAPPSLSWQPNAPAIAPEIRAEITGIAARSTNTT